MTIVYDVQGAQSVHHGERGIARYVVELALALQKVRPGLVDQFVYNPDLPKPDRLDLLRDGGALVPCDDPRVAEATLFHIASPMENGIRGHRLVPLATRRRARLIATLYDLIPLVFPQHYLVGRRNQSEYRRGLAILQTADALLAISQSSAEDAHRLLGIPRPRLTVIGAGAGPQFRPAGVARSEVLARLQKDLPRLRDRYLLVPTGIDYRKNVALTIDAYAALSPHVRHNYQLVIACRLDDPTRALLQPRIDAAGIEPDVLLTDYVADDTLVRLYQAAHLVVFPSRYEGFGLPPLEARACGTPVICGDNSSLREVIVDPLARFDADDVTSITAAIDRVLKDERFRASLAVATIPPFSWTAAAEMTARVYEKLQRRTGRFQHPTWHAALAWRSEPPTAVFAELNHPGLLHYGPGAGTTPISRLSFDVASGQVDRIVVIERDGHGYALRGGPPGSPTTEALARADDLAAVLRRLAFD